MQSNTVVIQNTAPVLLSVSIEQETIFFENEATYVYEASDADGDDLFTNEVWSLEGDELTLILTVNDNQMSQSSSLSDTVLIVNSLPTASYDGPTSQDALTELNPTIITEDPNGDLVTLSWMWMRNGFTTDYNQSQIPSSNLGAGDIWTALVTPNDGMDDGQTLAIDFEISNTAPVAVLLAPDSLIQGSTVTFSALNSSDIDGAVVNAVWSVEGLLDHSGMTFTTTMTEEITIQVKVIDDMGATNTISETFSGELPPYATNMEAKSDGTAIVLTWEGDANEWAIVHNGEVIDTTSKNKYQHTPTMEGLHTYKILPIVDGQQIEWER